MLISFFLNFNYDEAERYRKEAIEHFGKANKVTNQRYAVADLATDYMNATRFEEALALLDSVYNLYYTEDLIDSCLLNYINRGKVNALAYLGRQEEINYDEFKSLDQTSCNTVIIDKEILYLRFPNLQNTSISDDYILHSLKDEAQTDEDKVLVYYAIYQFYKSKNYSSIGFDTVDSLIFYQNAIAQNVIRESVTTAERDFYISSFENKNKNMRLLIIIAIIIVFISCFALMFFLRIQKLKEISRKAQLEANVEAIVSLKATSERLAAEKSALQQEMHTQMTNLSQLREKVECQTTKSDKLEKEVLNYQTRIQVLRMEFESENENKSRMLEYQSYQNRKNIEEIEKKHKSENEQREIVLKHLFREKWSTLSNLCEEYFEKDSSMKMRESIQRNIESEIRNIGTPVGLHLIEQETDRYRDGLVKKLRMEFPKFKEKDIQFSCLLFAGFSVRAICFILDITTNNFYVRKKRLIERLKSCDSPCRDMFLNNLS